MTIASKRSSSERTHKRQVHFPNRKAFSNSTQIDEDPPVLFSIVNVNDPDESSDVDASISANGLRSETPPNSEGSGRDPNHFAPPPLAVNSPQSADPSRSSYARKGKPSETTEFRVVQDEQKDGSPIPEGRSWMEMIGSRLLLLILLVAVAATAIFAGRGMNPAEEIQLAENPGDVLERLAPASDPELEGVEIQESASAQTDENLASWGEPVGDPNKFVSQRNAPKEDPNVSAIPETSSDAVDLNMNNVDPPINLDEVTATRVPGEFNGDIDYQSARMDPNVASDTEDSLSFSGPQDASNGPSSAVSSQSASTSLSEFGDPSNSQSGLPQESVADQTAKFEYKASQPAYEATDSKEAVDWSQFLQSQGQQARPSVSQPPVGQQPQWRQPPSPVRADPRARPRAPLPQHYRQPMRQYNDPSRQNIRIQEPTNQNHQQTPAPQQSPSQRSYLDMANRDLSHQHVIQEPRRPASNAAPFSNRTTAQGQQSVNQTRTSELLGQQNMSFPRVAQTPHQYQRGALPPQTFGNAAAQRRPAPRSNYTVPNNGFGYAPPNSNIPVTPQPGYVPSNYQGIQR